MKFNNLNILEYQNDLKRFKKLKKDIMLSFE